ncbi:GPI transamidase component GAA1 [Purpureocillium lavendulum]|uniref:GPI transamidase component GAA1 n=1 Tax=Purpureocillium lavendulum TaxID=1247861 RepID=A0AB34FLG0_9HYPO|nr:GPI transamidase component GAA1 [Purpureocillium lavendulum]
MPTIQGFSALRARSYVLRLPLFTRVIAVVIVLFWLLSLPSVWDIRGWGALVPDKVSFVSGMFWFPKIPWTYRRKSIWQSHLTKIPIAYRLSTFPLVHLNFLHAALNVIALTPLMERFESEYGTLTTLALFFGPLTTIPAILYLVIEAGILRGNHAIMGASIWVFLLLGAEAIRTYRSNPHLVIATYHIPTWTTPLLMIFVVAVLIPHTSLLGHLCGVGVGYLAGLGYIKFLAPPEWALRWIETRLNLLALLPHYHCPDATAADMSRLLSSALSLRRDPRMLKLPPYVSLLCIVVGVAWLLLLPLDSYSRRTYISENALLPGQVHTYFGGSEQNVFRAYRHELDELKDGDNFALVCEVVCSSHVLLTHAFFLSINDRLELILKGQGIKVGRQNYTYHSAGEAYTGENVYGILQAPRGDATEAIVLVAAWKSVEDQLNRNGVALALTLARYFKRWSLWSKDIIIVVPPDSKTGTQAWVDAYHDAHDSQKVVPLPLKSGALQGAIAIDYPSEQRFEGLHIIYDGTNGQLPNLDLINSIVNVASGQMGIQTAIQDMKHHTDRYPDRLRTMLRGMLKQGLGLSAGPHSSFIPYHVDSVTLQPYGEGWHDEMAMGRVIEGTFRSLNNLLEHLHQSFFFYLLMHRDRFVSIGTYLPSAMLLSASFTIMAIFLWMKSGQPVLAGVVRTTSSSASKAATETTRPGDSTIAVAQAVERDLFLPLGVVAGCQAVSLIPLFIFNNLPSKV